MNVFDSLLPILALELPTFSDPNAQILFAIGCLIALIAYAIHMLMRAIANYGSGFHVFIQKMMEAWQSARKHSPPQPQVTATQSRMSIPIWIMGVSTVVLLFIAFYSLRFDGPASTATIALLGVVFALYLALFVLCALVLILIPISQMVSKGLIALLESQNTILRTSLVQLEGQTDANVTSSRLPSDTI